MKKSILLVLLLIIPLLCKSQDTIMINETLPDTIEIKKDMIKGFNYTLKISYVRINDIMYIQGKTVHLDVNEENLLYKNDKIFYIPTNKQKKL